MNKKVLFVGLLAGCFGMNAFAGHRNLCERLDG